MSAFLGGFVMTDVRPAGVTAIAVIVESDFTDRYFQLYAGRRLIGVTDSPGQLRIIGQLQPADCPHALTPVMVTADDRLTNFGPQLPPRPLNQFRIDWEANSFPADSKWFEISAARTVDEAVDPDNVIYRLPYIGDGLYSSFLPPIDGAGQCAYRVTSIDDAFPDGNATHYEEITAEAIPYPPDVRRGDDGQRLAVDLTTGTLTVSYEYDW